MSEQSDRANLIEILKAGDYEEGDGQVGGGFYERCGRSVLVGVNVSGGECMEFQFNELGGLVDVEFKVVEEVRSGRLRTTGRHY